MLMTLSSLSTVGEDQEVRLQSYNNTTNIFEFIDNHCIQLTSRLFNKIKSITWCIFFVPAVVLPPLPGEGGEIYDDVVDPNLEIRWELTIQLKEIGYGHWVFQYDIS